METVEIHANLKEITNDFKAGLASAEFTANQNSNISQDSVIPKSTLNLGNPLVKVFCRVKNGVQFNMVTKNLPENIKSELQHFRDVKDQEIEVYKRALDQYGTEHLSPEIIEMINKYANSPLAPLIEFEIEKFNLMKAEVKMLLKDYDEVKA